MIIGIIGAFDEETEKFIDMFNLIKDEKSNREIYTGKYKNKELVVASQKYLADKYQAEAEFWGYIDENRWNNFYQWVNDKGLLEDEVPLNIGFTNEFLLNN